MRAAGLALLLSVLCAGCTKDIGELCEKERECEFSCSIPLSPEAAAHRKVCSKECDGDPDCPEGSVCFGYSCVVPCSQTSDCPEGSACWEASYCAAACRNQDDCLTGTCVAPGDVCQ